MTHILSSEERDKLRALHKQERDKRICDRIKAVLHFDAGWSYKEIAYALLLSDEAVKQHIQDYQTSQKLKPENGGSVSKLNEEQTQTLIEHLKKHIYLHAKDIVAYVKSTFGVEYTVAGMTNWLEAQQFSYKKPAIIPGKANKEAQEAWIKAYEKLKTNLPADEAICFMDGVHPTHNTKPAYGWIRVGERKEIPTNTGRQRINLSGAIDIISKNVVVREDTTLNAVSTIEFLKKIEDAYPEAKIVHMFCDNARYNRNKAVTSYLENSKIKLHFLPPYSPNLNPIERLWKFMNENVLYNQYYEKFVQFKDAVLGFLEGLCSQCTELRIALESRVTDNFRAIGLR